MYAEGKRALSASRDNTVRVWNLDSGACLVAFDADGSIACCAVAAGGRLFVAGDTLGRVHILRWEG